MSDGQDQDSDRDQCDQAGNDPSAEGANPPGTQQSALASATDNRTAADAKTGKDGKDGSQHGGDAARRSSDDKTST